MSHLPLQWAILYQAESAHRHSEHPADAHVVHRSVKAFADEFKKRNQPLHVLMNNGGDFSPPDAITEEGFEYLTGVNYMVCTPGPAWCKVLGRCSKDRHDQ